MVFQMKERFGHRDPFRAGLLFEKAREGNGGLDERFINLKDGMFFSVKRGVTQFQVPDRHPFGFRKLDGFHPDDQSGESLLQLTLDEPMNDRLLPVIKPENGEKDHRNEEDE